MSKIRNVIQTVQDRDVIKQAPDLVVYIDAKDYLVNPYLGEYPGIPVPFNDYFVSYQGSYDLEQMSPNCSLTFAVPNHEDHLFRTPGGNNLLETMAEIRVFSKGYYLSPRGNTVYRQIFRGFISSISYQMDGKMTNISVSCFGSLQLLERMQIDTNPSLMSAAASQVTPMEQTTWALNPYNQIAFIFLYSSMVDGFTTISINQQKSLADIHSSPYYGAVKNGYMVKWRALLFDLCRDVHIFPNPNVRNVQNAINEMTSRAPATTERFSKDNTADQNALYGNQTEPASVADTQDFYQVMRQYLPEMGFGSIDLLGSKIMTRLERLRHFTTLVGLEAYQDIDGAIIIKPPLYNLDVLKIDDPDDPSANIRSNTLADIYDQNNPFVVQLSEILSEQETEDESQVRATRVLAIGSMDPGAQYLNLDNMLTPVEDMDVAKMAQFGLRVGPTIQAGWFKDGDSKALFAYASTELARANRGFRTYSISIPLRPELKLGFPMYLPHKDIYGYIKNVSISYTRNNSATMQVQLDAIRRRPMFPVKQNVAGPGKPPDYKVLLEPQKDLVLQWTKPPEGGDAKPNEDDPELLGKIQTLPLSEKVVFDQDRLMRDYRDNMVGNSYMLPADGENCWRVQNDTNKIWSVPRVVKPAPKGESYTPGNDYYQDLQLWRPYTDGNGYEVIGTWPYGRFKSLKAAINLFTMDGILSATYLPGDYQYANASEDAPSMVGDLKPVDPDTATLDAVQSFLFTGAGYVDSSAGAAGALSSALADQASYLKDFKIFELTTNQPTPPAEQPATLPVNQLTLDSDTAATTFATVMLTGAPVVPNQACTIIDNTTTDEPSFDMVPLQ